MRLERSLRLAAMLGRGFQIFYGVGAVGIAAIALAVFVANGDTSKVWPHAARPTGPAPAQWSPPSYSRQIVYIVGSQRQADDLMAYGAGLSSLDPVTQLPDAKVTVFVANTPEDAANVRTAMVRSMSAHMDNASSAVEMIELR